VGSTIHVGQPLADRAAVARHGALRLVAPGIVLALLLALGTHFIVRRVTAPVVRYAQALDALDPARPQPQAPAHDGLPRELQSIGVSVARLLERVESALRHERTLTADAAHELRTPLAALRAQAQVAARASSDGERAEALQALQAGVDRATQLVSAMLTLARLDAVTFAPGTLPSLDLATIGAEAIDALRGRAQTLGVQLFTSIEPCMMRADADALAALLRNLLDNALRHARSRVHLSVCAEGGEAILTVADDGPGLSKEKAERVFDRFYRGGASGSGTGLGLAIVQRVVQLHKGSVHVDSGNSSGATFTVQLPLGT
jgi:signal transduction histidine kinase